jgi:hypothetical protein
VRFSCVQAAPPSSVRHTPTDPPMAFCTTTTSLSSAGLTAMGSTSMLPPPMAPVCVNDSV